MHQVSPVLFVAIPLTAAFFIILLARALKQLEYIFSILASSVLFLLSLSVLFFIPKATNNIFVYKLGAWLPALGVSLALDGLSALMLVTVNLISFLVTIYSLGYMQRYSDKWKFSALFMLMLAGMNGIIISADLFSIYVFLEVASIAGYALVAFGTESEDLEASFKYAVMGSVASIFILLGIAMLYSYTSTLNMADMAAVLSAKPQGMIIRFVTVLFLAGFGLKAAIVPFHAWLADAHPSAPAPVSAILSGVFIKTSGIYALSRVIFNILGVYGKVLWVFIILGVLSMVAGAFLAIAQKDIKRMFAYSSVSQIGYIIFALGINTPLAIFAALFHLVNHALFKSLLFLDAGAIEYSTGTRRLDKLGGLSSRLPVTCSTSLIGSLAISGIPPLGGFWSKLLIVIAAVQARYFGLALTAVLVSIITLAYYLKFQNFTFFGKSETSRKDIKEVPLSMKMPMIILAVICVLSGLLLAPAFRPFLQRAAEVLSSGNNYQNISAGAIK
ncbi:MAG: proton-conducting transporter membrane subunit [Candidatus Omnitrophica bacterium]|nr:proton-conducting transporter membrane subunit [Candidatus Omnitrophota bacterium]MDD5592233.1 proton-conducting transporter membrane subunit [Candidatus Omnitrophota bacterium]